MTDTPTPEQIAEALKGVTPGPWNLCAHLAYENENGCTCGYRGVIYAGDTDYAVCQPGHDAPPGYEGLDPPRLPRSEEIANSRFIAWARNNVEALAADRDAQKARAEKLGRELNIARYGQPDFSWSVHKEAIADLEAAIAAEKAKTARLVEYYEAAEAFTAEKTTGNGTRLVRARAAIAEVQE